MDKHRRRHILGGLLAGAAGCMPLTRAWAAAYPERPVKVIVPFAAGGSIDIVARVVAQQLATRSGGRFIVENRTGASGNIGAKSVAKATPDGYTLLVSPDTVFTVNPHIASDPSFQPLTELLPLWQLARLVMAVAVGPTIGAKTMPEFLAYVRSKPGQIACATPGEGTPQHLALKLLESMTGTAFIHVPYRGGAPAIADAAAGQVPMVIGGLSLIQPHADTGRLRTLGVTQSTRSPLSPQVPAIAETIAGFNVGSWFGLFAPTDTPGPVLAQLREFSREATASPETGRQLLSSGIEGVASQPRDFAGLIRAEYAENGRILKTAGVRAAR